MIALSNVNTEYIDNNRNAADAKKNASENSVKFFASKKKNIAGGKKKNNKAPNVKQF